MAFGSGGQKPDAQPPYLQRFAAAANSRCQLSAPHDAPYPRQRRYARSAEVCPRRRAAARAWPSTVPARRIPRLDMQSPAVQPSRRPGEDQSGVEVRCAAVPRRRGGQVINDNYSCRRIASQFLLPSGCRWLTIPATQGGAISTARWRRPGLSPGATTRARASAGESHVSSSSIASLRASPRPPFGRA